MRATASCAGSDSDCLGILTTRSGQILQSKGLSVLMEVSSHELGRGMDRELLRSDRRFYTGRRCRRCRNYLSSRNFPPAGTLP